MMIGILLLPVMHDTGKAKSVLYIIVTLSQ